MDNYSVKITEKAEDSLRQIGFHIAITLFNPQAAFELLSLLRGKINSLNLTPNRVPLVNEEPWHSYGIHKMVVKNYNIYFYIDEENKKVQITDVIYAKREQIEALWNMDAE